MTSWSSKSRAITLVVALTTSHGGATTLLHQPIVSAEANRPIPVLVTLPNTKPDEAKVTLYYRGYGDDQVNEVALRSSGDTYKGVIPAQPASTLGLRYWLQASGPDYQLALGSAQVPLAVELTEVAPFVANQSLWPVLGGAAFLLGVGLLARLHKRQRRRRVLEELFWIKHLHHLTLRPNRKAGNDIGLQLSRLARTPLDHPLRGLTMYPASTIRQRFNEMMRSIEWARLDHERLELLAPGHPYLRMRLPPETRDAADDVGVDRGFQLVGTTKTGQHPRPSKAPGSELDQALDRILDHGKVNSA